MPVMEATVRLCRALGLAPYHLVPSPTQGQPGGKYAMNSKYRRVGLFVLALLSAAGMGTYVMIILSVGSDGSFSVLKVTEVGVRLLNAFRNFLFLPLLWWRQQPLLLQVLNTELFRSLPALPRWKLFLPFLVLTAYALGLAVGSVYQWYWLADGWFFHTITAALLLVILTQINTALFAFLLSCVAAHIEATIQSLREMAESGAPNATVEVIVSLRRKHKEAVLTTGKLCSAFGCVFVLSSLGELLWIVKLSFLLFAAPPESFLEDFALVMDIAKSLICMAFPMAVAQQLTVRANYTTLSHIHTVGNSRRITNEDTIRELNEFSKQICQQPLSVSINGIVVLNLPLLFQALGVAATYVVVLLQFHQSKLS